MAPAYWKLPDPQVAARDPGQHGARQQRLAAHRPPGRHDGERAGGGDAEGVHRLADDVLAQHRADRGQAVAAAGERRAPGALEVQVAQPAVGVGRARRAAARARRRAAGVPAELVPGVGLRDRGGAAGDAGCRPAAARRPGSRSQSGSRPSSAASGSLSTSSRGVGRLRGLPGDGQLGEFAGEAVVENDGHLQGDTHPIDDTWPYLNGALASPGSWPAIPSGATTGPTDQSRVPPCTSTPASASSIRSRVS